MRQLPLFSPAAEGARRLREERDSLGAAYADLQDRYQTLWRERRDLRQDLAAAQTTITEQAARIDTLEAVVRIVETQRDTERLLAQLAASRAPTPPTPDPLFKRLLSIVHPDKWGQGQGAAELAHELTVAINAARAQLEVRP